MSQRIKRRDSVHFLQSTVGTGAAIITACTSGWFAGNMTGGATGNVLGVFVGVGFAVILGLGILYIHQYALKRLPEMTGEMREQSLNALLLAVCLIVPISVFSSYGAVATDAAKAARVEEMRKSASDNAERIGKLVAETQAALPTIQTAVPVAKSAWLSEKNEGSYSGRPGEGKTVAELAALHLKSESALNALRQADVEMVVGVDAVKEQTFLLDRMLMNRDMGFAEKTLRAEEQIEKINDLSAGLKKLIPLQTLIGFAKAMMKDFRAAGLEEAAAAKMEMQFRDFGRRIDALSEEIQALKAEEPKAFPTLNQVELITRYAGQLWPLLIMAIAIDVLALLPLFLGLVASRPAEPVHSESATSNSPGNGPVPATANVTPLQASDLSAERSLN